MGYIMELIKKGYITNRLDLKQYSYILRVLDSADLAAVMDLQNSVLGAMEEVSSCVPLSMEEHHLILQGDGEAIGLFIHNKLYAACSILFPGIRRDNMARELNFNHEELQYVAQLELSLVHPHYRGNKLQHRLASILARRAERKGNCRYLFTTVSPYNYPSIETVTSMGMNIAKLCKMYFAWDRYVVYKDFINPIILDKKNSIPIPSTAFAKQQELLDSGYLGFAKCEDEDGIKIMFAKELIDISKAFLKLIGG